MPFPRLYPIIDAEVCSQRSVKITHVAEQLAAAGVEMVQYRDKQGTPQQVLANAAVLRGIFGPGTTLIMNDRVDLALLANFDGVHLGQSDLSPKDAHAAASKTGRTLIVGLSTHTEIEVIDAEWDSIDYAAIGPVFSTSSKANPEPVVGLEGVRIARANTIHNLVAIGGITRQNAPSVFAAGADSIAVISAFFSPGETIQQVARDFLHLR